MSVNELIYIFSIISLKWFWFLLNIKDHLCLFYLRNTVLVHICEGKMFDNKLMWDIK